MSNKKLNNKGITIVEAVISMALLIVLTLIIIIEFPYRNYNGKLKIYFIDVGQRR